MATAKFDIKTEALKPVLAYVGVTDLAVEVVREAVADVQKRVSAEQLYVRAGIVHPDPGQAGSVELAVLADTGLTERQKQSLLDVYASFQALNERDTTPSTTH